MKGNHCTFWEICDSRQIFLSFKASMVTFTRHQTNFRPVENSSVFKSVPFTLKQLDNSKN